MTTLPMMLPALSLSKTLLMSCSEASSTEHFTWPERTNVRVLWESAYVYCEEIEFHYEYCAIKTRTRTDITNIKYFNFWYTHVKYHFFWSTNKSKECSSRKECSDWRMFRTSGSKSYRFFHVFPRAHDRASDSDAFQNNVEKGAGEVPWE